MKMALTRRWTSARSSRTSCATAAAEAFAIVSESVAEMISPQDRYRVIAPMWKPRELSPEAVESFVHRGFCTLEGAFTRQQAAAVRDLVWERMRVKGGIERDNPATWPEAYDIEEHLHHPAVRATFSDRLARAIEDLVGAGRWNGSRDWGLWPVNF